MTDRTPHELARETLKLLTQRKLLPTPENYLALYREAAGTADVTPFPDEPMERIAKALPAINPGQQKQRALFEMAVQKRDWSAVQAALVGFASFAVPPPAAKPAAPSLTSLALAIAPQPTAPSTATTSTGVAPMTPEFLAQLARLIEYTLPALGKDDTRFNAQTHTLLDLLRQANPDALAIKAALAEYMHRVSFAAEEQQEVKSALLQLLQLIILNIGKLSPEDRWLQGQVQALQQVASPPLSLRRLDEVGLLLKDVIHKQGEARARAQEAQAQLRTLLGAFIEKLGTMAQSSSGFHDHIAQCAQKISTAKSIEEIAPVLETAMTAAQAMAHDSRHVRDELQNFRQRADAAQAQIDQLHQELDRISAQARHDPLTGTLNRKGLDETMQRDVSEARRKNRPLSIALLDIDNFKKINDNLGHDAGDAALTHLAQVARESLRPQDSLARFGGEEFVILMPDTKLEAGIEAMTRLQRELTKREFLERKEKVLITFSAGVAEMAPDEAGMDTIKRADQAMFLAKRAGKNRVWGA